MSLAQVDGDTKIAPALALRNCAVHSDACGCISARKAKFNQATPSSAGGSRKPLYSYAGPPDDSRAIRLGANLLAKDNGVHSKGELRTRAHGN
jgi:hypothetical protein